MSKKILKLYQANEDGATDISTQFTPVTIDGGVGNISSDIEIDTGRFINGNKLYRRYAKFNPRTSNLNVQADVPIYLPEELSPILPSYSRLVNISWHIIKKKNTYNYELLPKFKANDNDSEIKINFNVNLTDGKIPILIISSKSELISFSVLPGSYIEYIKDIN